MPDLRHKREVWLSDSPVVLLTDWYFLCRWAAFFSSSYLPSCFTFCTLTPKRGTWRFTWSGSWWCLSVSPLLFSLFINVKVRFKCLTILDENQILRCAKEMSPFWTWITVFCELLVQLWFDLSRRSNQCVVWWDRPQNFGQQKRTSASESGQTKCTFKKKGSLQFDQHQTQNTKINWFKIPKSENVLVLLPLHGSHLKPLDCYLDKTRYIKMSGIFLLRNLHYWEKKWLENSSSITCKH